MSCEGHLKNKVGNTINGQGLKKKNDENDVYRDTKAYLKKSLFLLFLSCAKHNVLQVFIIVLKAIWTICVRFSETIQPGPI